jgi:hypothetical protein
MGESPWYGGTSVPPSAPAELDPNNDDTEVCGEIIGAAMHGWAVSGVGRQNLIPLLMLSAILLYLIAVAPGFRHRRGLRLAAVAVYLVAVGIALVWVARWLLGS